MSVNWDYSRRVITDIATRYASNISDEIWVLTLALLAAAVWLFSVSRRIDAGKLLFPLTFATCLGALGWAWSLRWIGDDAFISFRYARNLLEGHGLVYNLGERVEGYTNFAWTVLVAAGGAIGFDLAQVSVVLSLLCFALTIVWIVMLGVRVSSDSRSAPFSLAAAAFAANYAAASFGTSGLETMFCTLAVVVALERALAGAPFAAGLAGILATMAHPDHALFYAALGAAVLLGRPPRKTLVRYALPFFLLFVPYFAWRWSYYGYFFPNTFYAKSGDSWHLQQGARYLGLCALSLGLWGAFPLAIYEAVQRRGELIGRYALIVFPTYLLYVAKIGGDFMLGRLIVVLMPVMFVLAELALRRMIGSGRTKSAVAAALVFAFCAVPSHMIRPGEKLLNVADERTFYRLKSFSPIEVRSGSTEWARNLNKLFPDPEETPKIATGVVGIVGYETDFYILDIYGLLDPVVAHLRIRARGRPGHEKRATAGRIVDVGADLSDMSIYPLPFDRWTRVKTKPYPLFMPRYDRELVERLNADGKKRARTLDRYLERFRPSADPLSRDCQHWFLESYYFSNNDDPRRRSKLQERFAAAAQTAAVQSLYLDESPAGWSRSPVEDFDGASELSWKLGEELPFEPVADGARAGQRFITGSTGMLVNTFAPEDGDAARVTMTSSKFEVAGDALTFRIGGGRSKELVVELLQDGEPVRAATGCESDLMGRRVWDVTALRGERVRLRIRDDDEGAFGHLLVDTVEQWSLD